MLHEVAFALDRASARRIDDDEHLHVSMTNLSKANICPYYGREIPEFERLGLDAGKIYYLWRHPKELEKAAETFRGKPLLNLHVPAFANDHPAQHVVGAIGNDVTFDGKFLKGSITVWDGDSIARIESGEQKELSCGYRYEAVMTPGYFEGSRYDGIMRNIKGNHAALVTEGRAGPDVMVGDSRLEMPKMLNSRMALMASGAIAGLVKPLLAADAKLDLEPAFDGVTKATIAAKRADIAAAVVELATPLLAKDKALDADAVLIAIDAAASSDTDDDDEMAEDEDVVPPKPKKKMAGDKAKTIVDKIDVKLTMDSAEVRGAMDAAISKARTDVMAEFSAIREAERAVAPHIGEIAVLPETAAGVYKLALDAAKVDTKGVDPSAFKAMVSMLPKPDDVPASTRIAMDEQTAASDWFDTEILGKKKG